MLVLSAFDIVHTEPNDPFDLGLGFNLGIIDNDRSRQEQQLLQQQEQAGANLLSGKSGDGAAAGAALWSSGRGGGLGGLGSKTHQSDVFLQQSRGATADSQPWLSMVADVAEGGGRGGGGGSGGEHLRQLYARASPHRGRRGAGARSGGSGSGGKDGRRGSLGGHSGSDGRHDKEASAAFYEDPANANIGLSAPVARVSAYSAY